MGEKAESELIKKILLMPIVSSKSVEGITIATRKDDGSQFILSSQRYNNETDEDMSDIAISYYETIYEKSKPILNSDGKLANEQFAGDTMNSYRQIVSRNGCSEDKKKEWFDLYHCLANFWILPMEIGRKGICLSKTKEAKDYMDGFLLFLRNNYNQYKEKYIYFFADMNFDDFIKWECIDMYVENNHIIQITGLKNPEDSINTMMKLVDMRASTLSKRYTNELYKLFCDDLKLI